MRLLGLVLAFAFGASCFAATAHGQELPRTITTHGGDVGVAILSDTHGVVLDPYMKVLLMDLKVQWQKRPDEGTFRATTKLEPSVVDLTIGPDGELSALRLEATENTTLDKAAWDAAKMTRYARLPAGMNATDLKLRVEFFAN